MYVARGTPGSRHLANAGSSVSRFSKFFFFCASAVWLVRNFVALDNAAAGRNAQVAGQRGVMVLDVPGRRVQRLPDPAEIGLALGRPRHLRASRAPAVPAAAGLAAGAAGLAAGGGVV